MTKFTHIRCNRQTMSTTCQEVSTRTCFLRLFMCGLTFYSVLISCIPYQLNAWINVLCTRGMVMGGYINTYIRIISLFFIYQHDLELLLKCEGVVVEIRFEFINLQNFLCITVSDYVIFNTRLALD